MNKRYINWTQYSGLVQEICRQISVDRWIPDYVVGITRGGLLPATMISHYFDVPCQTLKISLRDHHSFDCESNLWMAEDAFGCVPPEVQSTSRWDPAYRKNILIVDDINDSGATINYLIDDWSSGCYPNETQIWNSVWGNNVRFAVLFDNLGSNSKISMNYVSEELDPENKPWIVFPYENWWQ